MYKELFRSTIPINNFYRYVSMKKIITILSILTTLLVLLLTFNTKIHASSNLGGLNLDSYCSYIGEQSAALNSTDVWICNPNETSINIS